MRTRRLSWVFLGALATAACATLPHPTPVDADRARGLYPEASLDTLTQGRAVYVDKCAGCHSLKLPDSQPAHEWPKLLDEMQHDEEVELAAADRHLIEQFLVTMAEHRPEK